MIDKGVDGRGIWRAIYSSIWDDPEFRSFTATEKLIFFNLRTGPQTNLPVIFCYYLEAINQQTGVGLKSIRAALRSLSDKNWIQIEGGIVWVKKGLRFDPNIVLTNPKHLTAIKNIILSLPKKQIVRDFIDFYNIPIAYPIASRIPYPLPYANQDTDTDTETETKEEKEEEFEEKPKVNSFSLSKKEGRQKLSPIIDLSPEQLAAREAQRKKIKEQNASMKCGECVA